MKNYLKKFVFVIACIGFMLSGCEKESNDEKIIVEKSISSRIVRLDEIPDIEIF